MIIISHRGNISGPVPEKENHPDYINQALLQGFDVEIDVWLINNKFFLGHDCPQYEIDKNFLLNNKFWHHAKNIDALYALKLLPSDLINCFFHDSDDCVLTSRGFIWTYPGKQLTPLSIAVMPEKIKSYTIDSALGVCTDYSLNYLP